MGRHRLPALLVLQAALIAAAISTHLLGNGSSPSSPTVALVSNDSSRNSIAHPYASSNFSNTPLYNDSSIGLVSAPTNSLTIVPQPSCGVLWGDDTRPLRIVVTCSDQYFPVLMNWLVHYHRICPKISNIFLICLDTSIQDRLLKMGLQCSHLFRYTTGYHNLWLARVRITQSLMRQGFDVLMADVDAVWLRNPFPAIENHIRHSDIIGMKVDTL